jgi:hypothetical protein
MWSRGKQRLASQQSAVSSQQLALGKRLSAFGTGGKFFRHSGRHGPQCDFLVKKTGGWGRLFFPANKVPTNNFPANVSSNN